MSDNGRMRLSSGSEDFSFVNHNKTDFESFRDFQEESEKIARRVRAEKLIEDRKRAIVTWDRIVPKRWSGVTLGKLTQQRVELAREAHRALDGASLGSMYIQGDPIERMDVSYAVCRKMVGAGKASAHQVKFISEEELINMSLTGFEGRKKLGEILDSGAKVFVLTEVGSRIAYDAKREGMLWDMVIDHAFTNSLSLIISSGEKFEAFLRKMGESSCRKLEDMVDSRVIHENEGRPAISDVLGSFDG